MLVRNRKALKYSCQGNIRKGVKTARSYTIEDMQEYARAKGGKCLSIEYINARTHLKWECKKVHLWKAQPRHVLDGHWCGSCAGVQKLDISHMHAIAKERSGKCLSMNYINSRVPLRWQCREGHIWEATPRKIKAGRWCPKCGGSLRLTIEEMRETAEVRGGKCLFTKYKNARQKLKWECAEGHIWENSAGNIRRGQWCPECSTGLGERVCRAFFEQLFKRKFPRVRPPWLKNREGKKLELDGYCKSLGLAFEHQGMHHYRHVEYFQSKKRFLQRQRDDQQKEQLCRKHGVLLIKVPEVPSMLKITEVKDFIIEACRGAGLKELLPNIENFRIDLRDAYTSDARERFEFLKHIARDRGGKCLNKSYLGMENRHTFKCENGHIWDAIPSSIIKGHWCGKCKGVQRRTLEEMQKLALSRGGKCLSAKYVNGRTPLKWRCSKGHAWEAKPNDVVNGTWCPECGGTRRGTIIEMRALAMEHGGQCLSREYVNGRTPLKWKCDKGHVWGAKSEYVKGGHWCHQCGGSLRLTIEEMHRLASKRKGKCLSKEYINARTRLRWQCVEGHIWEAVPDSIKRGSWCRICSRKNRMKMKHLRTIGVKPS
jgi:hypothetical protein